MPPLSARALAHLPFYEALATLDDATAEWRTLSAGLLTLRLFDRWIEEDSAGRRLSRWEVSGVGEAVQAVPSTMPARSILASVIAAASDRQSPSVALPMFAAYGRALQAEARWTPAADVYETVLVYAEEFDADLAMSSAFQRGTSLRLAGDLEGATVSYAAGRRLAVRASDLTGMLQADVGVALVTAQRGNLPAAEAALDEVIAQAEPVAAKCSMVLSRALHDRGTIALRRGALDPGVGFLTRALQICHQPAERERILSDLGSALFRAGAYEAARDAHLVVRQNAVFRDTRWTAGLNLLEIAAKTDNEPSFEFYRRELADAPLPPRLRTYFHMYVAEGHERFGRFDEVVPQLRRAIALAEQHGINEALFDAERRLAAVRQPRKATAWRLEEVAASQEVRDATHTVRNLRSEILVPL